jgi:hypothetical protein
MVSKVLSIILHDGTTAEGTLWMHPSCSGGFEVEYKGMRKTDYRTDYANEGQMRLIAVFILNELVDAERRRFAREKRGGMTMDNAHHIPIAPEPADIILNDPSQRSDSSRS